MKLIAKLILVTLVVVLVTAAFAADASTTTKFNLNLTKATTFAGVVIQPGDYKVFVDRTGDNAKVRILDGSKELVNTDAKYKQIENMQHELTLTVDATRNVSELQSSKLKGALLFKGGQPVPPADGGK